LSDVPANAEGSQAALGALQAAMDTYWAISPDTWQRFREICRVRELVRRETLYRIGEVPRTFAFVVRGLLRVYVIDEDGAEYNKNFFEEGTFPGSMAALLTDSPSRFGADALEPSIVVEIDFGGFRRLLLAAEDLKLFHIHYLEKNWLLDKDAREVALVQEDAAARYERFLQDAPAWPRDCRCTTSPPIWASRPHSSAASEKLRRLDLCKGSVGLRWPSLLPASTAR
jgi:hypothetical protein